MFFLLYIDTAIMGFLAIFQKFPTLSKDLLRFSNFFSQGLTNVT